MIILPLLIIVASCQIVFEEDISLRNIEVIAPIDGAVTSEGVVTFLWQKIEQADNYHLTVVSPSFAEASSVVVDTVLTAQGTRVIIPMVPGSYQWSISAYNSAYKTKTQYFRLVVK